MGDEMFRLKDRRGAELCLGMTHEEVFTSIATELRSLPRAAADLVPDPDQVPGRAAPQVGPAARARVRDEGLVLARPRPRGPRSRLQAPLRRVPAASSSAAASRRSRSKRRRARWAAASRSSSWWRATRARTGSRRAARAATRRTWRRRRRALDAVGRTAPVSPRPSRSRRPACARIEDLANFAGGAAAERQIKTLVYVRRRRDRARAAARRSRALGAEARGRDRRGEGARRDRRRDPRGARRIGGKPRRGRRRAACASSPTPRCRAAAT